MNTTIYSISESPRNGQVIWCGTDDGNLQITRDGGKTWSNVRGNIPGIAKDTWVSWVEAGRFAEGTAYATFDQHMTGDMKPHVFKTTDFGQTWAELPAAASGVRGYAHVIKEDTVASNLLFLGTEFGLWISADSGAHWMQYKGSHFPAVAVRDLVVHPRTSDLILATHGRGIWIIDDISGLRALTPQLMSEEASFLPAPAAPQWIETFGGWAQGDGAFTGPSRTTEAFIGYYQRTRHIFGDLKIEIFDAQGNLVDTVASSKHRGVDRAQWSMHLKPPHVPPAASAAFGAAIGPRVLPGVYTVKMTKNDKTYTTQLNVTLDPRATFSVEGRKAQFDLVNRLTGSLNHMSWAVDAIIGVRDGAQAAAARLPQNDALRTQLSALAQSADAIRSKIVATKEGGMITGEERLREYLTELYGDVNGYDGPPTQQQVARAGVLDHELEDVIGEFTDLTGKQLPALNTSLRAKQLPPLVVITEADWRKAEDVAAPGGPPRLPQLRDLRIGPLL